MFHDIILSNIDGCLIVRVINHNELYDINNIDTFIEGIYPVFLSGSEIAIEGGLIKIKGRFHLYEYLEADDFFEDIKNKYLIKDENISEGYREVKYGFLKLKKKNVYYKQIKPGYYLLRNHVIKEYISSNFRFIK